MIFKGLDPAGTGFELNRSPHRLDASDAKCVEVIHTSTGSLFLGGLGIKRSVGHHDIYPNGGITQAHCQLALIMDRFMKGNKFDAFSKPQYFIDLLCVCHALALHMYPF